MYDCLYSCLISSITVISVDYLIIRPMKDFVCDLSVTYAKHWRTFDKKGLDVGHRGAGNARRNDK